MFLLGCRSRRVEELILNGQGAYACVTAPCRPTDRFARGLLDLSAFGEIHDHFLDIGLRELTLLLFVRLSGVAIRLGRVASMRSRRCLTDSAVVALRLKRLRDLQHVTQTLVFDDGTLIDFGQPVVLPARQHATLCSEFDTLIRVLPNLDRSINQLPICGFR
ncbi:hypothetical protein WS87_29700 [Burkholderia sp. MSMB0856]|nr:hypothetical protein WS87_29700 [Burkholderia sp. MSMB0856]KVH39220.1 hypothetical protein WS87_04500 [Burkholderia sp. MSMB0856]